MVPRNTEKMFTLALYGCSTVAVYEYRRSPVCASARVSKNIGRNIVSWL